MSASLPLILLIDDNRDFCDDLAALLCSEFRVESAQLPAAALSALRNRRPDAVLLDIDLEGGESGLDFLVEIRRAEDAPPVIMMTGDRRIATAVRAVRLGAYDYLTKPPDFNEVSRVLNRALGDETMLRRVHSLERDLADYQGEIVTRDPGMLRLLEQIDKAAPTEATVLVTGESGTGKELVARRIHRLSPRAQGPFVALNCAAVPSELIESELFGHEKGSFTGATGLKHGAFEQARGGTLLLDELGDSPPALQAKLLRALEEMSFRRVGGSTDLPADVRIVAATSFDLEELIEAGKLRKELYYRLNVMRLHLPPLRERPDDVVVLAHHFLSRFAQRMGRPIQGFTPAAAALLHSHDWPGNVRELRNTIERGVILCDGAEVDAPGLAGPVGFGKVGAANYEDAKNVVVNHFKREYLTMRLREARGNVTRAAEASGLARQSFGRMCNEVGIDPTEFADR